MFILGLTGSIGMGKTTTAALFAAEGVPVYDADAAVHRLYEGAAVPLVEAAFPGLDENGRVDRQELGQLVLGNPAALKRLEEIVHPLLQEARVKFIADAQASNVPVVVLDIPLLLEGGGEKAVDAVVVVSASAGIQRQRVFERPGMTDGKFDAILAKQMPDAEKRALADFIVDTGQGVEYAREQVRKILQEVAKMPKRR